MEKKKGFLRGFLKFLLVLIIILVIIFAAAYFTTPKTFGLQNVLIGGSTLEELGVSELSFFDIATIGISMIGKNNESDFIAKENKATESDYKSVEEKFSSTLKDFDFSSILGGEAIFSEEIEIKLSNNEFTALFNKALGFSQYAPKNAMQRLQPIFFSNEKNIVTLNEEIISPYITEKMVLDMMNEFKAEVLSVVISSTTEVNVKVEVIAKFNVPKEFRDELLSVNLDFSNVIISFSNEYKLENEKLVQINATSDYLHFNKLNQKNSNALIGVVFSNMQIKEVSSKEMAKQYCDVVGNVASRLFNNLGYIKSAGDNQIVIRTRTR